MIRIPFFRSCDADSEYTKRHEIRLKNKGDGLEKLWYAENFPEFPENLCNKYLLYYEKAFKNTHSGQI